jgi:TolB protein
MARRNHILVLIMVCVAPAFLIAGSRAYSAGQPAAAVGVIAYEIGNEIRLVNSDGSGDHRLWQAPLPDPIYKGIRGLEWRPDGRALAFSSDYQNTCSIYDSDIYTINADGRNLKRLTNSPGCADLAAFPKGTVKVQVENLTTDSLFLIYVEGAPDAAVITVSPGAAVEVTIPNVADLGDFQQGVTVINGKFRWVDPSVVVNVKAGQTTTASNRFMLGQGNVFANVGATASSWYRDGSKVGFLFQEGFLSQISANPPVAGPDSFILGPNANVVADALAWSPISDWILYADATSIGVVLPGANDKGDTLISKDTLTEIVLDLEWLKDQSGFLFAVTGGQYGPDYSNIYEFNFASNELTAITNFDDTFAGGFTLSPDEQQIIFEYAQKIGVVPELWSMNRDGSNMQSLGITGESPDWRPGSGIVYTNFLNLPMIIGP